MVLGPVALFDMEASMSEMRNLKIVFGCLCMLACSLVFVAFPVAMPMEAAVLIVAVWALGFLTLATVSDRAPHRDRYNPKQNA